MAAQPQAGALVKARIEGKQGTHRIRVRAVSDEGVSFVHEWQSGGKVVQGKKVYTLPLTAVEVVAVLDGPATAEDRVTDDAPVRVTKRPRTRRPRKEPAKV
jgi:hypothetical protein